MKISSIKSLEIISVVGFVCFIFSEKTFAYRYTQISVKVVGNEISQAAIGATCYTKKLILSSKSSMKLLSSLNNGVYVCSGQFSDNSSNEAMDIHVLNVCRVATAGEAESNCQPGH